jgi:hypothetical protein
VTQPNRNHELWSAIRNEQSFFQAPENQGPIVISNTVQDFYGLYFTAQWYFPNAIFSEIEAQSLSTEKGFIIKDADQGRSLIIERR